uniref:Calcium uniporter protein C-terminal domain-containing protein n=1 Tax=Trypanosoma congolense (strain IL3000) TaxID=1068625 RepID=G0UVK2_TRYCI|nr:conserved hypothetical protein [Trypanosoma congolense IL3000]
MPSALRRCWDAPLCRAQHTCTMYPIQHKGRLNFSVNMGSRLGDADAVAVTGKRTRQVGVEAVPTLESLREYRDHYLHPRLLEARAELQRMYEIKLQCEKLGLRHADMCIGACVALVAFRTVVLFYWTYFLFDWNLVEPITYLLDYGALWLGLAWYGVARRDAKFESFRQFLATRHMKKLRSQKCYNEEHHELLESEVRRLEEQLRGLERV